MYRDIKKSKNIYTYDKTNKFGDDHYDPEIKTSFVNFDGNPTNFDLTTVIAHETGHEWRDLMNLDIVETTSPFCDDLPANRGILEGAGSVEHMVFNEKRMFSAEFEATHIENIVRSELGLELRDSYGIKTDSTTEWAVEVGGFPAWGDHPETPPTIYLSSSKSQPIFIGSDETFDYNNIGEDVMEKLKDRKRTGKEIDVNSFENPDAFTKPINNGGNP